MALAGLSMGGGQAMIVLKTNPGVFRYVGSFGAGFGSTTGVDAAALNAWHDAPAPVHGERHGPGLQRRRELGPGAGGGGHPVRVRRGRPGPRPQLEPLAGVAARLLAAPLQGPERGARPRPQRGPPARGPAVHPAGSGHHPDALRHRRRLRGVRGTGRVRGCPGDHRVGQLRPVEAVGAHGDGPAQRRLARHRGSARARLLLLPAPRRHGAEEGHRQPHDRDHGGELEHVPRPRRLGAPPRGRSRR